MSWNLTIYMLIYHINRKIKKSNSNSLIKTNHQLYCVFHLNSKLNEISSKLTQSIFLFVQNASDVYYKEMNDSECVDV